MSKRAEEAALKAYPPTYTTVKRHAKRVQSELVDTHKPVRAIFQQGYEQAEKDTIERAVKWLEEHADEYNGSESAFDHMEEEMITDFSQSHGGRVMTLSDLYRKIKDICGCLNSADVPLKCNGNDFNVDFEIKSKDAIVSHIEVKKDLALTWEDVNLIDSILIDLQDEGVERYGGLRQYYEEALKRFNEQKKI